MSTSQQSVVTLTPAHREGLLDDIACRFHVDELECYQVEELEREEVLSTIWGLNVAVRILDQLAGWQQAPDRDSYTLELDDDIVRFMRELERNAREILRDGGDDDIDFAKLDAARIVAAAV